jgi:glycerol-3-phosphate acyltransferase PlsY
VTPFLQALFCSAIGFLLGSIPFAWVFGLLILRRDVRRVGDGNPGSANAWKTGGWPMGVSVLVLDYAKGFFPVGFAYYLAGVSGLLLVPVALAPVLGHAFSPFLGFRGGKAVAVTFGIWSGLTLWVGPVTLALGLTTCLLLQETNAWSVLLAMGLLLIVLLAWQPTIPLLLVWLGNLLLLAWKHRLELCTPLRWRRRRR